MISFWDHSAKPEKKKNEVRDSQSPDRPVHLLLRLPQKSENQNEKLTFW